MMVLAAILIFLAGMFHGLREAFHADRKIFERLLKMQPASFFGSQQDRLKYNSIGGFKSVWWKYFPLDFWHLSRWIENILVSLCIYLISDVWYYGVAYMAIIASGGHLSYTILRHGKQRKNKG